MEKLGMKFSQKNEYVTKNFNKKTWNLRKTLKLHNDETTRAFTRLKICLVLKMAIRIQAVFYKRGMSHFSNTGE